MTPWRNVLMWIIKDLQFTSGIWTWSRPKYELILAYWWLKMAVVFSLIILMLYSSENNLFILALTCPFCGPVDHRCPFLIEDPNGRQEFKYHQWQHLLYGIAECRVLKLWPSSIHQISLSLSVCLSLSLSLYLDCLYVCVCLSLSSFWALPISIPHQHGLLLHTKTNLFCSAFFFPCFFLLPCHFAMYIQSIYIHICYINLCICMYLRYIQSIILYISIPSKMLGLWSPFESNY